jgi:hypothetical protein
MRVLVKAKGNRGNEGAAPDLWPVCPGAQAAELHPLPVTCGFLDGRRVFRHLLAPGGPVAAFPEKTTPT